MSASVPKLPPTQPDAATHVRRVAETVNNILGFKHDDSRIRTPAEVSAGVTPVNYSYAPGDVRRYGADATGVLDSSAAFTAAGSIAGTVYLLAGTYLIGNNVTVGSAVVAYPGALIRPASSKTLTFSGPIEAGNYQIFDLSLGGLIALPRMTSDVWAEWWGATGDNAKTNNEVPINQAIAALAVGIVPGGYGGFVNLSRGVFLISDSINLTDQITIRGHATFYTLIKANAATFNAATPQMILAKFGTAPMFNSRIEQLRIDAADLGTITNVIYAPAWQEKCGTDNVYIANFKTNGILFDTGYGGASQWKIRRTEIISATDTFAGGCIVISTPGSVGWLSLELEEVQCASFPATVTFTGGISSGATSATLSVPWAYATGAWNVLFSDGENRAVTLTNGLTTATWSGGLSNNVTANASGVSPNALGIVGTGRVIFNVSDVHFEGLNEGFILSTAACVVGSSIQTDGNATVTEVFHCGASWTGTINGFGFMRGGASTYIDDRSRGPYALANAPGLGGYPGGQGGGNWSMQTIWPPNSSKAVASARCPAGAASGSFSYAQGFSGGYVHNSTGNYGFTLSPSMDAVGNYHVIATSDQPQTSVTQTSGTQFSVLTKTSAGVANDAGWIGVEVYHSP